MRFIRGAATETEGTTLYSQQDANHPHSSTILKERSHFGEVKIANYVLYYVAHRLH